MKRADHHLVQRVLDGDLSPEDFEHFQERLRDEPALAGLYSEYAVLHHSLSEEFEGGDSEIHESDSLPSSRLRTPLLAGLVALLAVAGWVVWLRPWFAGAGGKDVATIVFSLDAVWQIEGGSSSSGDATAVSKGGVLHLQQGRAEISLDVSTTALLDGPVDLNFLDKDSLELSKGRGFFRIGKAGGGLKVATPLLAVEGRGVGFGIETADGGPDAIHVIAGEAAVSSSRSKELVELSAGQAIRVSAVGGIERLAVGGQRFATGLGRIRSLVSGPFDKSEWRMEYGKPTISEALIEGMNYAIFFRLPDMETPDTSRVLLATLELVRASEGEFHTDGWAGMSFYSKGAEVLFFGDSFGSKQTWSLDVKQRVPVIHPDHLIGGPRIVTLRYDLHSGGVSLHEGGVPLRAAFCGGAIPAGIRFDEIRLGASSGAALAVKSLDIRVVGE